MTRIIVKAAALCLILPMLSAPARAADWTKIADALGKSGTEMPGGVYRVGLPRTDLHVTLDGVEIKPTLALGSWLAFQAMGNEAMVMGDLVLTEAEANPVMKKLIENGIEVTALHNHLLRAQPSTLYMHILGHGDPATLAGILKDGLALSKTPLGNATASANTQPPAPGAAQQTPLALATAMISAQAINFQPTGGGKAAITGDFVLTAKEVNPTLRALRENGIEVTAVHNHMLDDQPRLFFMHFWANDDAAKLAKGLREALDKVNLARS